MGKADIRAAYTVSGRSVRNAVDRNRNGADWSVVIDGPTSEVDPAKYGAVRAGRIDGDHRGIRRRPVCHREWRAYRGMNATAGVSRCGQRVSAIAKLSGIEQEIPTYVGTARFAWIQITHIGAACSICGIAEWNSVDGNGNLRNRGIIVERPAGNRSQSFERIALRIRCIDIDSHWTVRIRIRDREGSTGGAAPNEVC